jgi:hypothetical protein
MIRVGVVCHGQTIEFNAKDTKAIAEAASALGVSFEVLQEQIIRLAQSYQIAYGIDELKAAIEKAELEIKNINYEFVSLRKKERVVYCPYKPVLHRPDKRRCFRPKLYWQRIRSNPR